MAAHRYWRIEIETTAYGGYAALAEVQLLDRGGVNRVGLGTASANGAFDSSHTAAAAVDGSTSTYWTVVGPTWWWQYDFGSGNAYDVGSWVITPRSDVPSTGPQTFRIMWSDDAVHWTTVYFTSGFSWTSAAPQTFSIPTPTSGGPNNSPHRYWRINASSSAFGSEVDLYKVELQQRSDGTGLIGSGTASASSSYSTFVATNAFDNNVLNPWICRSLPAQLIYDFGSGVAYDVGSVVMVSRWDQPTTAPQNFTIERSDDNLAWTVVGTFTGITWPTGGLIRSFSVGGASPPGATFPIVMVLA